ncbi:MAG: hypothetical protein WAS27_03280 [Candidatus Saccharimonadales bacterium]
MSRMKKQQWSQGSTRTIVSVVATLVLLAVSFCIYSNQQYVVDWVNYRQFTPSAEIARMAERTTMTDTGTFYFYASKPSIESATTFNASCDRKESGSAILGCYTNNVIYIYNIKNEQLDGIKEVTAAHEMLHAVYVRLSDSEKSHINQLLDAEYQKIKDDSGLADRMEFYQKHEAGEESNELHSIIATEVATISPELEAHYRHYFTDRSAVVQLHATYVDVFAAIKAKADTLLGKLKQLGPQIETDSDTYNTSVQQLNDDIKRFNARATAGEFVSRAEFDNQRTTLVARSTAIDSERARIQRNVEQYETLRQEYNATAATSNELYKSIDSNLAPSPSV